MDGLSENANVMGMLKKRNGWLVREHECCHEWMDC